MPRFIFLAYVSVIENVAKCLKMSFPRKRESTNLIKSTYLDCPVKPGNDKNGVSEQFQ